jgi:hypothetical protein
MANPDSKFEFGDKVTDKYGEVRLIIKREFAGGRWLYLTAEEGFGGRLDEERELNFCNE